MLLYGQRPLLLATHLSKLPLPQLLSEYQLLPWELGSRNVLPGEGVHGEGGDGVHVAASDALQPHNVRLGVVWRIAVETLVRCALGDVWLGIASTARCWGEKDDVYSGTLLPLLSVICDDQW